MSKLAVLTPAYNRAKYLGNLFESLCKQTVKDFEWWIVDDGSTDGTGQIVYGFEAQAGFPIHYIYKENGGKHTALNAAIPQIESELTIIVDSDDALVPNAVETILWYQKKYAGTPGLCGYSFYRVFPDGRINGKPFPQKEIISTYVDMRINRRDISDKAEVFFTKCLQEFPFPQYPGEHFLEEGFVWIKMSRKYQTVYISEGIYVSEYLVDGLTSQGRMKNIYSPRGTMDYSREYMESDIILSYRIKAVLKYLVYGRLAGYPFSELLQTTKPKWLAKLFVLPASLISHRWKLQYMPVSK